MGEDIAVSRLPELNRPLFLIGAERSGSTLLRLLLDHHPDISFNMEFDFVINQIAPDGSWPKIKEYHEWLRNNFIFQGNKLEIDYSLTYEELVNDLLHQKRLRDGKRIVGATIHWDFDRLLWLWPGARFIYLLRDGRDVARSTKGMGWAGNTFIGAEAWEGAVDLWREMKPLLAQTQYVEVRYERLVRNTEIELHRICDWIGVPFSEEMLDYPKYSNYKRPDPKLAEQWKSKLSERELRMLEWRIGDLLEQNGYELSGLPPLPVGRVKHLLLKADDMIKRFKWRVRHYGPVLTLSETFTRRLHLKPWHNRIKQQIYKLNHRRFA